MTTLRSPVRIFRTAALLLSFFLIMPSPASAQPGEISLPRISVVSEGQGPDVVFIPGLASSADVWRNEAKRLKDRYRVHLVQVRGFAGTDAGANGTPPLLVPIRDDILAYVRQARLQKPTIVGHSMGGLLAMMVADADGNAVGKLMIVDSLPFVGLLGGPQATAESVTPSAARLRDQILAQSQTEYSAGQVRTMSIMTKSKGPEALAALVASQTSDRRVVAHAMHEVWITDVRPRLPGLRMKVVVLYAFDVTMGVPQAAVDGMYASAYAGLPNRELVRIDNSYHFIQIDQADRFHAELEKLLSAPLQQ
jgi:pimeloyl-ACP methyl ester carboxylesterase